MAEANDRTEDEILPFSWTGWDLCDTFVFNFTDVIFRDFGDIPAGMAFELVAVDYENGTIECYEGEKVVRTVKFKLAAGSGQ